MEAISTTWINFVEKGGGGSPEFINSQTGDTVSIIAFVIAVLCAVCSFVFARYAVPANHAQSSLPSVFSNAKLNKILAIVLGAAATVSLLAGIAINSTKALAESNGNAEVSDSINAVVDEATGAVTIDAGWIKSGTGSQNFCEDVCLNYEPGISGLENCTWSVQIGEIVVAEDVTAPTPIDIHEFLHEQCVTVDPAPLVITVNGLDAETAKSLIGKKVLQIDFRVYTPEQNDASQFIDNGWNEILAILDNEYVFPDTALYPEFKDKFREDINEGKKVADDDMKQNPTEYERIQNEFITFVTSLGNEIEEKRDEIIADKVEKENTLRGKGYALKDTIEAEPWFARDDKNNYSEKADVLIADVDDIDNTKSQEATDRLYNELDGKITSLSDDVNTAAQEAETTKKEEAVAYAENQKGIFEAFLAQSISDGLWEEDAETVKGFLGDVVNTHKTSIQNASSLNELDAAEFNFDNNMTQLKQATQMATAEDKKAKEAMIAEQTQSLNGFKALFESAKPGLYQGTISDIESTISDISDGIDSLEQETSQNAFNAALAALRTQLADASVKLQQATREESPHKSAQLAALEEERETDKGEIETTPRLSDGKKDEFKASIDGVIDAANDYVSNDAASTTDAEDKVAEAKAACNDETGILKDAIELVKPWNVKWPSYDVDGSQHWIYLGFNQNEKEFQDAPQVNDPRTESEDFSVKRGNPNIFEDESETPSENFGVSIARSGFKEKLKVTKTSATEDAYNVKIKVSFESVDSEGSPLEYDSPAPGIADYVFTIHVNYVFLQNCSTSDSIIFAYKDATSVSFVRSAPTTFDDSFSIDYGGKGAIKAYKISGGEGYTVQIAPTNYGEYLAANKTSLKSLFKNFQSMTSFDLSQIYTGHVTEIAAMFSNCLSLTTIELNFPTSNVYNFSNMFDVDTGSTSQLQSIGLGWNFTTGITSSKANIDLTQMFQNQGNLENIVVLDGTDWSDIDPGKCAAMFTNCTKLPNWDGTADNSKAFTDPGGYLTAG